MFFMYVLQSVPTGRFYIGAAQDLAIRLAEHNAGKTLSTRSYRPWKLIHSEAFASLSEARQRERQVKSWKNRAYIIRTLGLDI